MRAKYLKGERDVQGELGAGFSGAHEAFLLNGGVQGPYVNGNVDWLLGKGFLLLDRRNTLDKVKKPKEDDHLPAGVHPRRRPLLRRQAARRIAGTATV